MLRRLHVILAIVIATASAESASAATVGYLMITSGNTWTLSASASRGDNFGIAGYSFPLGGGITSIEHKTPATAYATGPGGAAGPAGFTVLREATNTYLFAGQDTTNSTQILIRGFGQTSGSFSALSLDPIAPVVGDAAWSAPLVIATGTWAGTFPTVIHNIDLGAAVFTQATGKATAAALVTSCCVSPGLNIIHQNIGERTDTAPFTVPLSATGAGTISWSDLSPLTGPGLAAPAVPATLIGTNNATFSWNPIGSPRGPSGSGAVYQWRATATDTLGSAIGIVIELRLVPEPATMTLVGFGINGFVIAVRRRSRKSYDLQR